MMFGHEFERENVKHFVEAGRELLGSKATLKGSTPLLVFLAIIPLFLGFIEFDKGYEILPGIASVMCVVVILIYLKRIEKKEETYASRFISMGLDYTAFSFQMLVVGIFTPIVTKNEAVNIGPVVGLYILFFVIIFGGTLYGIKRDWYRPRVSKFQRAKQIKMIAPAAVLGATAGGLIFKRFTDDLGPDKNEKVIAYLALMVAVAAIFGITNFLKAYYVKKYGFTDPYEDGWYKPKRRKLKEAENEEAEIEGEKSK